MKLLIDKAREYADTDGQRLYYAECLPRELVEASFLAGAKEAMRWISVKEELPEDNMSIFTSGEYKNTAKVLVRSAKGNHALTCRRNFMEHGWKWSGSGTFDTSIVAWRPIELEI